jgi:flagellar biosynthesis protein FlhG
MTDQADRLHTLWQQARETAGGPVPHRRLVVSGGRPNVGATTLTLALGLTLAREGLRVVLVDADLARGDLTAACHVQPHGHLADVLAGRRTVHETLVLGPDGTQVLPAAAAAAVRDSVGRRAIQRLLRQLEELRPHADWLVVDAGNQPSELAASLWTIADRLLVVTSPEAAAVMDTYALMKTLLSGGSLPEWIGLAVNQAADVGVAADVHRRIDQSCQRFLGLSVQLAGAVPHDPQVAQHRAHRRNAGRAMSEVDRAAAALARGLVEGNHGFVSALRPAA